MNRFFLCSNSRTGSTLIKSGVNACPDIWCDGETLTQGRKDIRPKHPVTYFNEVAAQCDRKYWGTKYMSWWLVADQALAEYGIDVMKEAFPVDSPVIITDRRNMVKREFSAMYANRAKCWFYGKNTTDTPDVEPFELDIDRMERVKRNQQFSIDWVKENYNNVMHLYYEDFSKNDDTIFNTCNEVVKFIAGDEASLNRDRFKIRSRQTPMDRPPKDYVINIDEIENKYGKGILD